MKNKLDSLYCQNMTLEDNRRALRALVKEEGKAASRLILMAHAKALRLSCQWSEYHSTQYLKLRLLLGGFNEK